MDFDLKDPKARFDYEEKMKKYKEWRWGWSFKNKYSWVVQNVLFQLFRVALLYGGSAYYIREALRIFVQKCSLQNHKIKYRI